MAKKKIEQVPKGERALKSKSAPGKSKQHMPDDILEAIKDMLKDGKVTAKELQAGIEANPKFKEYPKYDIRTYGRKKNECREALTKNPFPHLDDFWSIGQLDDGIPPYAINTLIKIQRLLVNGGHQLTIRRSLLIARLYQVLDQLLEAEYKANSEEYYLALLQISSFYTGEDQKADMRPVEADTKSTKKSSDRPPIKTYANTFKSLDLQFLIGGDVKFKTILIKWVEMFFSNTRRVLKSKTIIYKKEPLLSSFIAYLVDDDVQKAIEEIESQPHIRLLALRWMALSTRDELTNPTLYVMTD
jgi:hypothetical protein